MGNLKLRDAFMLAIVGRQKSLSVEHFGDLGSEVTKIVKGQRRPTFDLLEAAFDANPDPLFDYLRSRYGVRIERIERPLAEQLGKAEVQLSLFREAVEQFTDEIRAAREQQERVDLAERERLPARRMVKVEAKRGRREECG